MARASHNAVFCWTWHWSPQGQHRGRLETIVFTIHQILPCSQAKYDTRHTSVKSDSVITKTVDPSQHVSNPRSHSGPVRYGRICISAQTASLTYWGGVLLTTSPYRDARHRRQGEISRSHCAKSWSISGVKQCNHFKAFWNPTPALPCTFGIFRHASVFSTYPCLSVRPQITSIILVILSDFHSVSVSGRPTWKVEERGPHLFVYFGSG